VCSRGWNIFQSKEVPAAGISELPRALGVEEDRLMALLDDIPVFGEIFGGGNWVTGLAIGVGAVIVLPLAAPILRPLIKTAISGGLQAYRGASGWVGDLVAEAVAESGGEVAEQAVEVAAEAAG
jgi:hypothetical protein